MNLSTQAFLALLPILISAVLLVGFRWSAKRTMPIVFLITAIIATFIWGMSLLDVLASSLQGLFITFDILYIIFGAILSTLFTAVPLLFYFNTGWIQFGEVLHIAEQTVKNHVHAIYDKLYVSNRMGA